MAVLHVAIEGEPFEEGFHQTLPKTINFPRMGRSMKNVKTSIITESAPSGENSIKSLWKRGSGKEPFLRKVFPR